MRKSNMTILLFILSPFKEQSNYNGYQNSMRETYPSQHIYHTYGKQHKVSQTSTARRESTKDRRKCKLPAVRKTRARI